MIIGIDIGGTTILGGVVDNGEIVVREHAKTPQDKEEFVFAVKNVITYLLENAPGEVTGIGIGCPGPLDAAKGIILNPPNLPHDTNLGVLRDSFDVPIVFHNDANCFALAEAIVGSGKGKKHVLGITLGTGFGCGLVVEERLFTGRGNACEMGHVIMRANEEERFPKLVRGSIEQYVGSKALMRLAAKYELEAESPIAIAQIAQYKNEKALAVFKEFGRDLGIALANCIHAYDPDIIVIGGSIASSWQYFEDALHASLEEHAIQHIPNIVRSQLKDAGVIGAAMLVEHENI